MYYEYFIRIFNQHPELLLFYSAGVEATAGHAAPPENHAP